MRGLIPMMMLALMLLPASAEDWRWRGMLAEARMSFGDDFQIGLRPGYEVHSWNGAQASLFADMEIRPVADAVRVRASPGFSYQYREIRGAVGPGVSLGVAFTDGFTGTLDLGASYTWGNYVGSNREPPAEWIGWADVGVRLAVTPRTYLGTSLQVRPLPGEFPVRAALQFGFLLGDTP